MLVLVFSLADLLLDVSLLLLLLLLLLLELLDLVEELSVIFLLPLPPTPPTEFIEFTEVSFTSLEFVVLFEAEGILPLIKTETGMKKQSSKNDAATL